LEQHRVIDLLPDRTTDTVASWLKNQPSIEVCPFGDMGNKLVGGHE
jgi:transposase